MDRQEVVEATKAAETETVWETLTIDQQETVLRTIVWICCQVAKQKMLEVNYEWVIV
jgi:hypothetical protein